MDWIRTLLSRCFAFFRRNQLDARLEEELSAHIELAIQENMHRGMTTDEARTAALRTFGGVTQTRENYRVQRGLPWLEVFMQDLRYALRRLRKSPGFTLTAVLALALGIGPNVAIFSIVWATFFQPLPYPNPDQLVVVWPHDKNGRAAMTSYDYVPLAEQSQSFQRLDFSSWLSSHLTGADHVQEDITGSKQSPGIYTRLFGVKMAMGRDFLPDEGTPGKDHVVTMNHRLWVERFNSDPQIVGKTILVENEPYTVVGVLAPLAVDHQGPRFYLPKVYRTDERPADIGNVFGRLKPGVTLAQAQAELATIDHRMAAIHKAHGDPEDSQLTVEPLHNDWLDKKTQRNIWMLLAAVGLVLMIACANVASLLLARGAARRQELAVRAALGASRRRIFAQLLIESLTLAVIGGALGVFLGWGIMKVSMSMFPELVNSSNEAVVQMNLPVLGFALLITLLAGVIFGCAPGWSAGRAKLNETLRPGTKTSQERERTGTLSALVVSEVALALTLLAGAGMAIHSFWKISQIDLGFTPEHLVTGFLNIPIKRTSDGRRVIPPIGEIQAQQHQFLERLRATPGVSDAMLATSSPLNGDDILTFHIAGESSDKDHQKSAIVRVVSPEYFRTLGIQLVRGRFFNANDRLSAPRVAVVNETFAHRFLGTRDPLTQRIELNIPDITQAATPSSPPPATDHQIVGIFHDSINSERVTGDIQPEMIISFDQNGLPFFGFTVRTAVDPADVTPALRRGAAAVIPGAAIENLRITQLEIEEQRSTDRFGMALFGCFAGIALLLSAVGIYGVMTFVVQQRTQEVGIRMALGAERSDVVRMMLRAGLRLAIVGVVIGIAGAWLLGQAMHSMLYGMQSVDMMSLMAVGAILLAVAVTACWIPARRAAGVDPMKALRAE
jgi:putative ABC transport system permease protein